MARPQAGRRRWPPVLASAFPVWEPRRVWVCWRRIAASLWPRALTQLRFAGLPLARAASAQASQWALLVLPRQAQVPVARRLRDSTGRLPAIVPLWATGACQLAQALHAAQPRSLPGQATSSRQT